MRELGTVAGMRFAERITDGAIFIKHTQAGEWQYYCKASVWLNTTAGKTLSSKE